MPCYRYVCPSCTPPVEREVIQKYDDPAPKCEKCSSPMERPLTKNMPSFQLVGSGWARDGYIGKSNR